MGVSELLEILYDEDKQQFDYDTVDQSVFGVSEGPTDEEILAHQFLCKLKGCTARARGLKKAWKMWLKIPKQYRDIIAIRVMEPGLTEQQVSAALQINRDTLYERYKEISVKRPEFMFITPYYKPFCEPYQSLKTPKEGPGQDRAESGQKE